MIATNRLRIYESEQGSDASERLLFEHGAASSASIFKEQALHVRRRMQ